MRRIDELKKEIIHEILNSEEYREYRRLQSEIDRTPDLKRQVDEFRMKNFELQNSENVPDMFAAMENLNKEYAESGHCKQISYDRDYILQIYERYI